MSVRYRDLRQWLSHVEDMGALKRVKGVSLDEDVGRIAELCAAAEEAPALLFEEFPGYEKGFSILLNPFGTRRVIAYTFGFPPESDRLKLLAFLASASRV